MISALLFGSLSDRYGRARMLGASYLTRGVGTLLMSLHISNEWAYLAVVGLAIGPTFGTVAVGNVLFYELVGPRMAGVILGISFIVHQIGSAGGPMIAESGFRSHRQLRRVYAGDEFNLVGVGIGAVSGSQIRSDQRDAGPIRKVVRDLNRKTISDRQTEPLAKIVFYDLWRNKADPDDKWVRSLKS